MANSKRDQQMADFEAVGITVGSYADRSRVYAETLYVPPQPSGSLTDRVMMWFWANGGTMKHTIADVTAGV